MEDCISASQEKEPGLAPVVCIVVEPEEEVAWHRLAQTFCRIACLADCPDWVPAGERTKYFKGFKTRWAR